MSVYGRDELEWNTLTEVGLDFLVDRARLQRLTSYTELNQVLARRTGHRAFDFEREDERAAMGYLLGRIVDQNHPTTLLMISALVTYLNSNDAGPEFFAKARELGDFPRTASADERLTFWSRQVKAIFDYYAPARGDGMSRVVEPWASGARVTSTHQRERRGGPCERRS